ncbi:hypothetical protein [Microbispora sp. NBC_01389]|uniref:GntT/GntP/DsdX family permease n=1 Tax=Microbispora sp. NBC_01389 TaxID=2903584 RepID=UPI00324CB0EE
MAPQKLIDSFSAGLGSTVAGVGVLIALGAILGKLLADSGGADEIVDGILRRTGDRALPWAMTLIAVLIGLPIRFSRGDRRLEATGESGAGGPPGPERALTCVVCASQISFRVSSVPGDTVVFSFPTVGGGRAQVVQVPAAPHP